MKYVIPGNPGFFNCLANHDTILLELFGQNGVEERVETRVQWQDEDGEDLGLLEINQIEIRIHISRLGRTDGKHFKTYFNMEVYLLSQRKGSYFMENCFMFSLYNMMKTF